MDTFAITDIETTGDVPGVHEILEIGLVLCDRKTFKILDTLNIKVKPKHIETAIPKALALNGYKEENWKEAVSLEEAMRMYAEKTAGTVFCAFNATFDWGFMSEAFRQTKVENKMDYHRLDILTLAWDRVLKDEKSWSLKKTCELLGILPEPDVHTALNGAMTAYKVFHKLTLDK
jgi:DNA polymerase III alpha subunit (gram-positive type)